MTDKPSKLDAPDHVEALQEAIERRDEEASSLGDRAAAGVVRAIGSWRFIGIMFTLLFLWVAFNGFVAARWLTGHGFDPYPFAILNIAINAFGAFTLPFVLLAENLDARQARLTMEHAARESEADRHESAQLRGLVESLGRLLEEQGRDLHIVKSAVHHRSRHEQ